MKKAVNKLELNKIQVTRLHNLSAIKGGYYYGQYDFNNHNDDDDDDGTGSPTQTRTHMFK